MNEPIRANADHSPAMASAALILGMISIIMIATGFSVVLGSIGIIMALLSRGAGPMAAKAKTGFLTSFIGLIGGLIVITISFYSIFSDGWEQGITRLNSLYQTYVNEGTLDSSDVDQVFSKDTGDGTADQKTAISISWTDGKEMDL